MRKRLGRGPQLLAATVAAVVLAGCGTASNAVKTPPTTTPKPPTHATSATSTTSPTGASAAAAAALMADQAAEALARSASSDATTYGNNNNGNYSGMSATALVAIDSTLPIAPGSGKPYIDSSTGVTIIDGGAGYSVTATSASGDTFSIGESATGTPTESCTGTASSACQNGSW